MADKDTVPGFEHLPPEVVKQLSGLTFNRSAEYRAIYSNLFRTLVGVNELTLIWSKIAHTPGLAVLGNVIEEEAEVVMGWPQAKMLLQTLAAIIEAFEQEIGEIKIPANFVVNAEGQRKAVQGLGFASDHKK